ncbi:TPA: restriction endonuclease subunit S [Serratia marcescens]|nr:restriction endonuclease subunit S [Serratia marcescens]HCR3000069.1 restriction endonuclease subunit S [Serratia marcescens]HCR3019498.1 restriction endonuclease subunit S [Serratia marcescens]
MQSDTLMGIWPCKQLVDCTADGLISYGIVQPGQHDNEGVPIVRVNNFNNGRLDTSNVLRVAASVEENYKRTRLSGGEVLLTLVGSTGQTVIVSRDLAGWNVARAVAVIRPSHEIGAKWINICLQSVETKRFLDNRANTTVQKTLNLADVKNIPIPVPPAPVRHGIESVITAINNKIDLNRRINQTLEAIVRAIFKSWFVDFNPVKAKITAIEQDQDPLRAAMRAISGKTDTELVQMPREHHDQLSATAALFPDEMEESDLGEIPKGWAVNTLGSVTNYLSRGISPKYLENGGVLVLNQKCIRDFRVDESKGRRHDSTQRKIDGRALELGDVLINSTGVGTLGRVAQVLCLNEPTIVDSHVTVVRASHELNASYLGQYIIWKQPNIEAMGEGSTGQTELSRAKLAELPVLTPRENVLKVFDNLISPLNNKISANDRESVKLAKLRDTLLPKLLSGELSVSDVGKLANTTGAA